MEATQTGDLDRSSGKNNFVMRGNPGFSPFVLEQSGLPGNIYSMKVTGIEPSSNYVFSCWVAWDEIFDGDNGIVSFSNVSSQGDDSGFASQDRNDLSGAYINDNTSPEDKILSVKEDIGGLTWFRLFSKVSTNENADLGYIHIKVGDNFGDFKPSTKPLGKRFFTDLRFEKVNEGFEVSLPGYLDKLRMENDTAFGGIPDALLNKYLELNHQNNLRRN